MLGALTPGEAARGPVAALSGADARGRRACEAAFAVGVALGPAAVLLSAASGREGALSLLLILACLGSVGCAGFGLLVFALIARDVRGARALLLAVLAIVAAVALFPAAAAAGREVFVARHATELDALARAALAAPDLAAMLVYDAEKLGFSTIEALDGGVFLGGASSPGPDLLYRDGASNAVPDWCARAETRFVGAGWYLFRCRARRN